MQELGSVLVIRLSALGDVLFAMPAVSALASSGMARRITWLVEDRAAGLVRRVPGLDEVAVFPRRTPSRWLSHAVAMTARRDDLVLDLQGNAKSRLQRLLLRAPRKVGYDAPLAREGAQAGLSERFVPPLSARHRVAAHLSLLASLGVPVPRGDVPRPVLGLAQASRRLAADVRAAGTGPLVLLHPGTSVFGRFKRWAPSAFADLGNRLVLSHGARLLISGGPGEDDLVHALRAHLQSPPLVPPTTSLDDLMALLDVADLVVAADSLPLHLANALGTPVLGLYGPKDPDVTGPFWDRARVVRAGVACSPCTLRRCGDPICMERLTVEAAFDAAVALLAAGRG